MLSTRCAPKQVWTTDWQEEVERAKQAHRKKKQRKGKGGNQTKGGKGEGSNEAQGREEQQKTDHGIHNPRTNGPLQKPIDILKEAGVDMKPYYEWYKKRHFEDSEESD